MKPKSPTVSQIRKGREEQSRRQHAAALEAYKRHRRWERAANLAGIFLVLAWGGTLAAAAIVYLIEKAGGVR